MRARLRSYGLSSTRTRSPGRIRIRKRRILPATWPSTSWPLSSCTLNIAFGSASTTSPSNSTLSSLGIVADRNTARHGAEKRLVNALGGGLRGRGARAAAGAGPTGRPGARAGAATGPGLPVRVPVAVPVPLAGARGRGGLRRGGVLVARVLGGAVAGAVAVGLGRLAGLEALGRALVGLVGAGLVVLDAGLGVLAEERRGDERVLGLGEVAAVLAVGDLHVLAPDRRRDLAAGRALAERAAVGGVADPHGGR